MKPVTLPQAIESIKAGNILIYPTETFYGLGVDIKNPQAIERLFQFKGRETTKAVSILVPSLKNLKGIVADISPTAKRLMEKFLPGPLTLVLPADPKLNPKLHANTGWIGIRHSSHSLAQSLVKDLGRPITTTSANPSGQPSAQSVEQIKTYFEGKEQLNFLSGGDLAPSKGSTVLRVDDSRLELLREGEIKFAEIENYLKETGN